MSLVIAKLFDLAVANIDHGASALVNINIELSLLPSTSVTICLIYSY